MDTSAAPETPSVTLPRQQFIARLVLIAFCLYVVAIYILALDQNLHWGLFPNTGERLITAEIRQLGNPALTKEVRETSTQDIINWNILAVPPLLKAIESGPDACREPALKILQTIALKYYNIDIGKYGSDPVKLKKWWADLQAEWAKAETEAKS